MKISKLFHWLYAILMLLPFLVFLPNAFYYGFNEHAVAQEKTEQVPVYYDTNVVSSLDDIVEGNMYRFTYVTNRYTTSITLPLEKCTILNMNQAPFISTSALAQTPYFRLFTNEIVYNYEIVNTNQVNGYISSSTSVFDIVVLDKSQLTTYLGFEECPIQYVKDYIPLTTSMSITDSMSYAWDSVWQNDLFSWSYGSFLTDPFIYIGNVFNVPNDNSLYYALSYWLDISIIWLCFDVIMYVPLLVHRWLDKGIVE